MQKYEALQILFVGQLTKIRKIETVFGAFLGITIIAD